MTENLIPVETEQRLVTLAVEINTIREQTRTTVLTAACEIGKRLIEAKNNLPHGMWGEWLANNVDCSERQAQQLMALYDEYAGDARALSRLSVSQAVALLAAPDEVARLESLWDSKSAAKPQTADGKIEDFGAAPEELIESGAAEDMSVRELKAEIARQKQELESRQVRIDELTARADAAEQSSAEDARRKRQAEKEIRVLKSERQNANTERLKAINERDAARKELEELRAAPVEQVEIGGAAPESSIQPSAVGPQADLETQRVSNLPPEVEAELDSLRERVRTAPDAPTILARAAYDRGVAEFRRAKEQLLQMDATEAAKYAHAFAEGLRRLAKDFEKGERIALD